MATDVALIYLFTVVLHNNTASTSYMASTFWWWIGLLPFIVSKRTVLNKESLLRDNAW